MSALAPLCHSVPVDVEREQRARLAAFRRLEQLESIFGEALPARALRDGFFFEERWIPFTARQGIHRPRTPVPLELPISIRTSQDDPYADQLGDAGLSYAYRSRGLTADQARRHSDNRGLRAAMKLRLPVVYFHAVSRSEYQWFPAWIVGDDEAAMRFQVAIDVRPSLGDDSVISAPDEAELRYGVRQARVRLHQVHFRTLVMRAYRDTCAVCRLRGHRELLDASHIRPDSAGGKPNVRNGLSLCKIHHAAFDANIVGVRPDYVVEVNAKVLEEVDGPMLRHGLQERHGETLILPRRPVDRPDPELLEERYERFRKVSA